MSLESKKQAYKDTMGLLKAEFEKDGSRIRDIESGCTAFGNVEEGFYVSNEELLPEVEAITVYFTKAVQNMTDSLVVKASFKEPFDPPHPSTYLHPVQYNNLLAATIMVNVQSRINGSNAHMEISKAPEMLDIVPEAKKSADAVREFVNKAALQVVGKTFEEKNIWGKADELRFSMDLELGD